MKKIILILTALFVCAPAMAANKPVLDDNTCRTLQAYRPDPSVDYKPGADVHGKPVIGADLSPSVIQPPEEITFDIGLDVAQYTGLSSPNVEHTATIGKVTVKKDGSMLFNGQPVEGPEAEALRALCAKK